MNTLSKRDHKFIQLALNLAESSPGAFRARIASVIVLKNQIISVGFNSTRSDPFQARFARTRHNIWIHSEIAAIKSALNRVSVSDLRRSTLYVARVKKTASGEIVSGLAAPCLGCQRALVEFDVKTVIFTTYQPGEYQCWHRGFQQAA
jgi:deoxycytidylate deaminase